MSSDKLYEVAFATLYGLPSAQFDALLNAYSAEAHRHLVNRLWPVRHQLIWLHDLKHMPSA